MAIMLAVDVVVHRVPIARAWRSFTLHLFAPGYNFFLIGLLTAVPFVILAVLILLHLGVTPVQEPLIPRRRASGLAGAGLGMLILASWTHLEVLLHPDAQGALAYLYLGHPAGQYADRVRVGTRHRQNAPAEAFRLNDTGWTVSTT